MLAKSRGGLFNHSYSDSKQNRHASTTRAAFRGRAMSSRLYDGSACLTRVVCGAIPPSGPTGLLLVWTIAEVSGQGSGAGQSWSVVCCLLRAVFLIFWAFESPAANALSSTVSPPVAQSARCTMNVCVETTPSGPRFDRSTCGCMSPPSAR